MDCADASELMDDVLDGRADSVRQAALVAHTADCAACRTEWSVLQQIQSVLEAAPRLSPPPDFTHKVMAHLARRGPAQNPWAGAVALFAGTVLLSLLAMLSLIGAGPAAGALFASGSGNSSLLQAAGTLVAWVQAGWSLRQVMLSIVPLSLITLYALLTLVSLAIWLGLIAGVQGAVQPVDN